MAGVLVCLMLLSLGYAVLGRRTALWRMAVFSVAAGFSCIFMTGLPEQFFSPQIRPWLLPLKAILAPASSAIALSFLVRWSLLSPEDALVRTISQVGVPLLWLSTAGLIVWSLSGGSPEVALLASAAVVSMSAVQGGFVVARGVAMGDRSAHLMVLALLALAVLVPGLHARALGLCEKTSMCAVTALATIVYFAVVLLVGYQRIRQQDLLRRQAAGVSPQPGNDRLPRGVALVEQVESALWRSERMDRPCFVAAVVVTNLYALGDRVPRGMEQEAEVSILVSMVARIRQAVGFRNVLGLYHQRCFVLAVSAVQDAKRGEIMASKLMQSLRQAVTFSPDGLVLPFEPDLAMGVVKVEPGRGTPDAVAIMNLAEQLALEAVCLPGRVLHGEPGARPAAPQGVPAMDFLTQPGVI